MATTLEQELARHVRESPLVEPLGDGRIRCLACGHRCPIFPGLPGVCKVRFNDGGRLMAPYGYVNALHVDPIEKKPFFHALPGARALSFGMLGCDLHCAYCQNWLSSQALRDPRADLYFHPIRPEEIVEQALATGSECIVSTYNEPLITAEWAVEVFRVARRHRLVTGFVSNGNATPEVLEFLRPWLDLFKVDLKSFRDENYRRLGGRLGPVLDSIRRIHEMGFWLEVVTLVVPGFNDSDEELGQIARFLASISVDIPWHVTAFHPDYKMEDVRPTSASDLLRAVRAGKEAGLRYVYAGNLPGLGELENTRCWQCGATLIERYGFRVLKNRIGADGRCPSCLAEIAGFWRVPARTAV
ncbi:MAG: AmmeMemoRadiSam system radical SAM enzyme [Bryobacteraceae bacterium]|nr:MAG: AmmeMemoRadiSam system radical SAM enzyme [Bryobacteraceae bacterium]